MLSRKRLAVMLDRDVWYCNSREACLQGMAGLSLAGDDLWALLCAGFEVREKIPQHRVSTEGGRETGGTLQRVEWCSFRSWLRREWPGRLPREVVAKCWVVPVRESVYAASRPGQTGDGVGVVWAGVRGLTWCQVFGAVDDRRKGGEAPCGVSAAPAVGRAGGLR